MTTPNRKTSRLRRASKARHKIRRLNINRLSVYRSSNHIYAQVFSPCGTRVITSASSLDNEVKSVCEHTGNSKTASLVGELLAKRCKEASVSNIAFDRSGYKYHGRVKALAEALREGGMQF